MRMRVALGWISRTWVRNSNPEISGICWSLMTTENCWSFRTVKAWMA